MAFNELEECQSYSPEHHITVIGSNKKITTLAIQLTCEALEYIDGVLVNMEGREGQFHEYIRPWYCPFGDGPAPITNRLSLCSSNLL